MLIYYLLIIISIIYKLFISKFYHFESTSSYEKKLKTEQVKHIHNVTEFFFNMYPLLLPRKCKMWS